MGRLHINGVDCGEIDKEEFEKALFESMEEACPEFVWNGKLVKSTKYKPEAEEEENNG